MATGNYFNNYGLEIGGKKFSGNQVVFGIAAGITFGAIWLIKSYFNGPRCKLQKDLTGKNVVITGGSDGIGKQTARRLLELNAKVIIGARDENRNKNVVEQLSKIGKGKIISFKLDLADRTSIQNFAANIRRQLVEEPLHYLLNNGGVFAVPELRRTTQNTEMQMGVNHFGHFYLTYLLWQKLKQAQNPRIVTVSSALQEKDSPQYEIDFNNINFESGGYNPLTAYSRSKKANVLFAKQLQRKMQLAGISGTAVSLHPGMIWTNLSYSMFHSWWSKIIAFLTFPFILLVTKSVTYGAQTSLYCLLEDDRRMVKGGYYKDCKPAQTQSKQVENLEAARRLWQESQKVFGIRFNV